MPLIHWEEEGLIVCGADEAGRGCLCGPVTGAAVILPSDYHSSLLNDSKQLSARHRDILRSDIEINALAWAVTHIPPERIDQINILWASVEAMQQSVGKLSITPELLLIDGNRFKTYRDIPHRCIVKGDGKYLPIAAASILAKTHRDELMEELDRKYPHYLWKKNKGYPTKDHRDAIRKHGVCQEYRRSFRLLDGQTKLDF